MLNRKNRNNASQRSNENRPTLRARNGEEIELEPIQRGSVVPTGKSHTRETDTRETRDTRERTDRDEDRPGARVRESKMRDRLYNILDEIGPYDVLTLVAEYCECERDEVPKTNQPYRAYWRRAQLVIEECAERFWKIKVNRNKE
jgi:hypothetical protein